MHNIENKFFEIDGRTREDIILEFQYIASSYVPEWIFNNDDPDVGTVIANLYADMLQDDISKLNMLMYKYRIELGNMMGLSLKPARPSRSMVTFSLLPTADKGVNVPSKTKLIANTQNGEKVIFETQNSMFVTNSEISEIFLTSKKEGKTINVYNILSETTKSFNMFDFSKSNMRDNEIIIGHPYILNLDKNTTLLISLSFNDESEDLIKSLSNTDEYEWRYFSKDGAYTFDEVSSDKFNIILKKSQDSEEIDFEDKKLYYISLKKKDLRINHEIKVDSMKISSHCQNILPKIVYQENSQVDVREFYPFGDKLAVYNECYVCANSVMNQKNSKIKMKFNLKYIKNAMKVEHSEQNEEYRLFMKKPMKPTYEVAECRAERVMFEYFNGLGWAKLEINDKNVSNLFSGQVDGDVELEFYCPDDMSRVVVNAYLEYWIRISLLKSDNCYKMPSEHLIPVISDLSFSYEYENNGLNPEYVLRYSSMSIDDITMDLKKGDAVSLFKPIQFENNSVFIGFNKKIHDGPISIYFDIDGGFKKNSDSIRFEYSSIGDNHSFKPLKIIDETENFRHSGAIIFIPPSDFVMHKIFQKDRFWIKIFDENDQMSMMNPIKINDIIINTIAVENIETQDPETFYVDREEPNIKIQLTYKNILYSDVFVNEVSVLSIIQMDKIKEELPDSVIAEYDLVGNYTSFYIKWTEVDTFAMSGPNDRHYILDRINGIIIFGNANKGMIPPKQIKPAIQVFSVICNGQEGNVEKGSINRMDLTMSFINNVSNPVDAFTGHDVESVENALKRGSNILSNYNRLVSETDFEEGVLSLSNVIDKVRCLSFVNEYGIPDERSLTIAVLMKEFDKSSQVFSTIKNKIIDNILKMSSLSLKREHLNVIEPIFVKLSIDVWIGVTDINNSFDLKSRIIEYLKDFINPITGNFTGRGWEIGRLPRDVQIYSLLKTKSSNVVIKKVIITGKIQDENGMFEKEVDDIGNNPFVIGINGEHNIFIDLM